ncbi:hypothetical protein [Sandaracinus amylolyticus]|nr:hypothetical protein [Sandaracinus amylolyticus]
MRLQQHGGSLANRTFIATDDFTVADVLMSQRALDAYRERVEAV